MLSDSLKLNQALLLVNKINISDTLEVYYQLEECFGCPLDRLRPQASLDNNLNEQQERFVIDTQHEFHLELRQLEANVTKSWCKLDDLSLNSYGRYRIDVSRSVNQMAVEFSETNLKAEQNRPLRCELNTLDSGECLMCPVAIMICILLAALVSEQIYAKFWPPNRRRPVSDSSDQDNNLGANTSEGLKAGNDRIESLDIFRGLTLAGMIFVNYGGAGYAALEHTAWDGLTLADLVFPFFIFSMGASVAITARGLLRKHQKSFHLVALRIIRRALILAMLGIFLNSKWIDYDQAKSLHLLRLTGVLQRFSVSYLIVALMYCIELKISEWTRAQSLSSVPYLSKVIGVVFELLIAVNYGAIYVYFTFFFQFDLNCPVGYIGPGGRTEGGRYANCTGGAAAWIDRLLLGPNHMYNDHEVKQVFGTEVSHDPEGILGYTTSILLTLIGLQCGKILIRARATHKQKILSLSQMAMAMAAASSLVVLIPINKRLWSLTFITVSALAAYITVILFYTLVDVYSYKQSILLRLLSSAGKNSIFLYVGHSLVHEMLPFWFPIGPQATHLELLLRLSWSTFVWILISQFMATRKLFIKV